MKNTTITNRVLESVVYAINDWCFQHQCHHTDFEYSWDDEIKDFVMPEFLPPVPMVQFLNNNHEIIAQNWLDASTQPLLDYSKSNILNDYIYNIVEKSYINIHALTWTLSRSKIDRIRFIKIGNNLYDIWSKLISDSDTNVYPKSKYLLAREKERYC